MLYKIFKQNGLLNEVAGYYDEEFIYNLDRRKLFKYHSGKITTIENISTAVAYYKAGVLYDNMLFSNVLCNFSDQKVYKGMWSNEIIGYYEGNRGYCAAALLILNSKSFSNNNTEIEKSDSVNFDGNGELLFAGIIGKFIAGVIILMIIYAVLNAATYFWGGTIETIFSLPMLLEYLTQVDMDADTISNIVIVMSCILSSIWVVIHSKDCQETLLELILQSYIYVYKVSIPICLIITLFLEFKISTIFGIVFSGAIVVIFPAVIAGTIRYFKQIK